MKELLKLLGAFFLIAILAWSFLLFKSLSKNGNQLLDDYYQITNKVDSSYLSLFGSVKNEKEFKFDYSVSSSFRNSTSFFNYKDYVIQVYKLSSSFNLPLKKSIVEDYSSTKSFVNEQYGVNKVHKITFLYRCKAPEPNITKIIFKLYGKQTVVQEKNDSLANYYSNIGNFSIKYGENQDLDIVGQPSDEMSWSEYLIGLKATPIEILFLKKENQLYLLTLTTKRTDLTIRKGLLYSLLDKY